MPLVVNPDAVRAVLDLSLDSTSLPNETIWQPIFADRAVNKVREQIEDADELEGSDLQHALNAVNFYCAAYLAPSLPNRLGVIHGANNSGSGTFDAEKAVVDLLSKAEEELELIEGEQTEQESVLLNKPTIFGLASGTRGY